MTIAVILILGILWVAVLVPPVMRARGQQGHGGGISDFTHRLASVGRTLGHRDRGSHSHHRSHLTSPPVYVPMGPGAVRGGAYGGGYGGSYPGGMSPQQKRRRDVLLVLGGAAGLTLLLALFTRSTLFIVLFLVAAAALGGYVYLLLQYKQREQERSAKVRYLGAEYRDRPSYGASVPVAGVHLAEGAGESANTRLVPMRQQVAR